MASRLASPTCPASSTTSVSKAPSNSGLQKWKAVPPTMSAVAQARSRVAAEAWTGLPGGQGLSPVPSLCATATFSIVSPVASSGSAARQARSRFEIASWLVAATATRRPAATSARMARAAM